ADLVARPHGPARAHEPRTRPLLLGLDQRPQQTLERRVQPLDEGMSVVQAAPVDPDDDLRPRRVERLALQPLDRLAPHLSVQMARARPPLEARARGLVRGASRADDETAAAGR